MDDAADGDRLREEGVAGRVESRPEASRPIQLPSMTLSAASSIRISSNVKPLMMRPLRLDPLEKISRPIAASPALGARELDDRVAFAVRLREPVDRDVVLDLGERGVRRDRDEGQVPLRMHVGVHSDRFGFALVDRSDHELIVTGQARRGRR